MAYNKRVDGRAFNEARDMEAKAGVVKRADGSAMFRIGKTIAIASVFGPRELFPGFLQNPETGILRSNYDMLSFSVNERKRPGPNRRSVEISMVTNNSLLPALDLTKFPNTVVDVFIEIIQADSGTRCAGICAASMALADAGIPMKGLVSAVSVGKVGNMLVVDLNKEEEDYEEGATDIPIAMLSQNKEVTLLQLDGDVTQDDIKELIKIGSEVCEQIHELQVKALKDKYQGELDE